MYDMPWLGAVLRKLSQTPCLTLSTPSHQTGRSLSRLQFKNWTREQFHCDFWKLSLQHSPLSLAAPEAQTGPHVHITNTSSLAPPPCSPGLIPGSWQGALAIHRKDRSGTGAGLCWAPSTGTASHGPTVLTFLWSQRQEECYSNPSAAAQTRNHYFPCFSTNQAPVELPVHICQETFLENGERRLGTVAHLLWLLNGKHAPSKWDREKYCCAPFSYPKCRELWQGSNALPLDTGNLTHTENKSVPFCAPEKYQLGNPAWLWEEHSCKNPTGKPWA